MVVAFASIATASARMPDDERFSDLYLADVAAGTREVTVFFADPQRFTKFSEDNPPAVVRTMLNAARVTSLGAVTLKTPGEPLEIWELNALV